VRQPYVDDLAARFAADCSLIRHGSPELVVLAEAKLAGERLEPSAVAAAIQPMLQAKGGAEMDVVVLACTHFPLLAEELANALPHVAFVDGGPGIARRIGWLTKDQSWPAASVPGTAVFTGTPPTDALRRSLAGFGLDQLHSL
jgi:glutamate racemase